MRFSTDFSGFSRVNWLSIAAVVVLLSAAGCGDADDPGAQTVDGAAAAAGGDGATALADGVNPGTNGAGADGGAADGGAAAGDVLSADDGSDPGVDVAVVDAGSSDGGTSGTDGAVTDTTGDDGTLGADTVDADTVGADTTGAADAAGSDTTSGDTTNPDAAGSDTTGGPIVNGCPTCLVDKQPTGLHPGAKGACSVQSPKKIAYGSGFGQGYKDMLVYRPSCAGGHPVLFFVHEKRFYNAGGIIGKLGEGYRKLMEHVASHGTIAVFVRVETGLLDADHDRMAQDLLAATKKLFASVSVAVKSQVVFAGHGMGAKVALLAAAETYGNDAKNQWANPRAVLAFGVNNAKGVLTSSYTDVSLAVKKIPWDTNLSVTFIQANDDAQAPYLDPKVPNALAVYDGLKIDHKQIIVLHGTGKGDKNPPTSPELHDDHGAPLTLVGKPGGIADFINKTSYLDGLDWYGYWKITVGALNFHFNKGDKKWAYGSMRSHGGTTPGGGFVVHEVLKEQWKNP